ncbi:Gfo/Idh/MocA family protein [Verrucomicrobium spinosum]|uniref:Gfo/Idh/MocA family protein n=1 Tax=Verrucomicrobium spinosum TaxID=2736 RepID=UPI00017443C1|nr:Gfo/Idh/MocA family oxidoreductase [Verrucomicrobium spinosum]
MNPVLNRRSFLGQSTALASVVSLVEGGSDAQAAAAAPPEGVPTVAAQVPPLLKDVPLAPPDKQPPDLNLPVLPAKRMGWAVVGLGSLALEEILPAFARCETSRLVALVSGHRDKAEIVAKAYGVNPKSIYGYDNYDQLASNPEVDVVYIVLPNSMHAEYTIRAHKAGKHVLCEKPMAVSLEEAERMMNAAKQASRKLMIAYRLHYEPLNRKVMDLCAEKAFGAIKSFSSSNCQNVKAPNIRLSGELGGGPLGDVGVYSINAARYVIGEEPVEVTAIRRQPSEDPRFREVLEGFAFTLRYPSGVLAHCDCSFGSAESRRYVVHCAKGVVEMNPAFSYRGLRLFVTDGETGKGTAKMSELLITQVDHFAKEMDAFSKCIIEDQEPRTPGEMGIKDMKIIRAIEEAARRGETVQV